MTNQDRARRDELDGRERRARAVREALASSALEGVVHSEAFLRNLEPYVRGEINARELGDSSRD